MWIEFSDFALDSNWVFWLFVTLCCFQILNISRCLNHFLQEFSKELDDKSSLKAVVVSTGSQLLHLKEADTATLRAALAQLEQKWTTLVTQLPDIQEKLHQVGV